MRAIKIYIAGEEDAEPIYATCMDDAIKKTGCSKSSIRRVLAGEQKTSKGFVFKYASPKSRDLATKDIVDATQTVSRSYNKKVKVVNAETGEEKVYKSRTALAEAWGLSLKYVSKMVCKGLTYKGIYRLYDYSYEDEKRDNEKKIDNVKERATSDIDTSNPKDLILSMLSKIKYEKFESIKPKQIRKVLPFKQWIEDEYYSGTDAKRLYPYWKRFLSSVFDEGHNISEVILSGSIGTGKTTASLYGMAYKLYTLSCYENTAGLFNLMSTSKIAIMYFTLNLRQAEKLGYGQLKNILDSIPYFREKFPRNDKISSALKYPENVEVTYGSGTQHAIGLNLICSLLDEANFFQGESTQQTDEATLGGVYDLYTSILARGRSRYMHNGWNHSVCFLVSSSTHKGSFTEQRISEGRKTNFAHMRVAAPRLWDVKPPGTYKDEWFYVFGGGDSLDPCFIKDIPTLNKIREHYAMPPFSLNEELDEACELTIREMPQEVIIAVPIDFYDDFDKNMYKALQDIAGFSTSPSGFLFTSRPTYHKCINDKKEHPFTKDVISISTGDDIQIHHYLKKNAFKNNRHKPYFISIDASTKHDSTGISMVHLEDVIYEDNEVKPIIEVDFKLRIIPPEKPHEISITKIRNFVKYLRDVKRLNIQGVSYDQYASVESIQLLVNQNFNAIRQSVIKNDVPHKDLTHLLYEQRLIDYYYTPFTEELFNMVHDNIRHKVFISPGATLYHGDTYMSLVGAIHHLLKEFPKMNLVGLNLTSSDDYTDEREKDALKLTNDMLDNLTEGNHALTEEELDRLEDELLFGDDWLDY